MARPLPAVAPTLVALTLALSACANHAAELRFDALEAQIRDQELEHFVRTFALTLPERAIAWSEANAQTPTLASMLERGELEFDSDAARRELVTLLFAERDYAHLFVFGTQLTRDGHALADALVNAGDHGLDPNAYRADEIRYHLAVLERAGDVSDLLARLQLSWEDEALVLADLRETMGVGGTLPDADAAFTRLATAAPDHPLPDFAAALDELTTTLEVVAESAPTLELLLASGFLRLAEDQQLGNPFYVDEGEEPVAVSDETPMVDPARLRARQSRLFREAAGPRGFSDVIAALAPPFEQYRRLTDGLATYRGYEAAGGWEPLSTRRTWTLGRRGEGVLEIRRRLAAETYFDGDLEDPTYDQPLRDAVRAYQRTHQLRATGTMTEETYASMNIPVERRIAQIILSLDKWRASRRMTDLEREHIWVNIPDFHAELWEGEERVRRWRIVVGRQFWRTNQETGEQERAGRTPIFSERMEYIVFNPYWNVPNTIRREEYDHEIEGDPKWMAQNGFEFFYDNQGNEWLRQLPGSQNALGLVKFLFPNEHDVYMHDTNARQLFDRPTRSFSHGCMRVDEPMELAHVLLARDRDWSQWRTEAFIEEKMGSGEEEWVTLVDPLAIHVEYIGVRGGDDGRMHFLADPYRYDRPEVDVREAEVRRALGQVVEVVDAEPDDEG